MVFSDPVFIFGFLPIFLIFYHFVSERFRNAYILLMSLGFYAKGEPVYVWVLLLTVVANYSFGVLIDLLTRGAIGDRATPHYATKTIVTFGILFNLGLLLYFKYSQFFATNVNIFLHALHSSVLLPEFQQALPLGISFFTFQGISYVVDVYRGDVKPTTSLLKYGTYKTLFPQLIAGPIVRYAEVAKEMDHRTVSLPLVAEGLRRFVVGFIKKVLIADTLAATADSIFGLDPATISTGAAWVGSISYALQIYFDFSAYSDMAIGLGLILGFRYPENFDHPYVSTSIREFWRRWHMTLSFWFRDYVYRPIGGNRAGAARTYVNLFTVFCFTGFWHGASWTFVLWGIWHGVFMMLERRFPPEKWGVPTLALRIYALSVVLLGWVMFRADSFGAAFGMTKRMLFIGAGDATRYAGEFAPPAFWVTMATAILFSAPIHANMRARLSDGTALALGVAVLGSLFIVSGMKVLAGGYSPFLYFRF